ncbi:hypothetical protein E2C01_073015 [Portunus trituberculatus]|uniref:Zonadhesin n=1 Tax=Portunus trituberculatus TaxID=210409 RepID=A0A5B7IAJ1_PORTR|nr:hypothetical protein [Portunus trituberculatus]
MRIGVSLSLLPLLLQLAAALYYKARPLMCPVTVEVEQLEKMLEATQLEVVTTPFLVSKVQLNTVYESRPVSVTHVALETVTAKPLQLDVTEVQLVLETVPLTDVKVSTVTLTLSHTLVERFTLTATNYVTHVETLAAPETVQETVTAVQTQVAIVTQREMDMVTSTLTQTEAVLQTELVVEVVSSSLVATTTTQLQVDTFTSTHVLTKMITQTICPPPSQFY